jgi:hypothetical protein
MTRTLAADAVMSACAHSVSDRPGSVPEAPAQPVSGPVQPASGGSACVGRASRRAAVRSCRLGPARRPLPHQRSGALGPPRPRQPVPAHPPYWTRSSGMPRHPRWSFDPGRDILCLLISPLRWLQWP